MLGTIVGLAGCTNSGKTTLTQKLKDELFSKFDCKIATVAQDDFFKEQQHVRQLKNSEDSSITFYHYDEAFALDEEKLRVELQKLRLSHDLVLVDGNMITELPSVLSLFHTIVFIQLDYETCKERRQRRTDYDPPDGIGYFDQVVWPAYLDHLKFAESLNDPRFRFVNGSDLQICDKLLELAHNALSDRVCIQKEVIEVDRLCSFVTSAKCGGISVFIGTTRESFEGKTVKLLEYECYEEMALSEMRKLCHETRQQFPAIDRIAITHRIGEVPVTEKSVVIAASSPHRLDAIQATQFLIDRLKATVPIWKKEIYDDNQSTWKENAESLKKT